MTGISAALRVFVVVALTACSEDSAENSVRVGQSNVVITATLDGEVIQVEGSDRAVIVDFADSSVLQWQRRDPHSSDWRALWRSGNLYGSLPTVQFADVNGDAKADLFWTLRYEEIVGGAVVLDLPTGARHVPLTVPQCAEPLLEKTREGYRIRAEGPGVFAADECTGMDVGLCPSTYAQTWPRFFRIRGVELVEDPATRVELDSLGERYRQVAALLDSLYSEGASIEGSMTRLEDVCGSAAVASLRALADSAAVLADRRE